MEKKHISGVKEHLKERNGDTCDHYWLYICMKFSKNKEYQ